MAYAHRVAYELARGPVPRKLFLDHLCGRRSCCNPDHLDPVTTAENNRRSRATKLTAAEVEVIRRQIRYGVARDVLARRHGVSVSTIHMIATDRVWKGDGALAPLCSDCYATGKTRCALCGDETFGRGLPARLCAAHAFGEGKQTCLSCGKLIVGKARGAVVCTRCQIAQSDTRCLRCTSERSRQP